MSNRFFSRIEKTDSCWSWVGYINPITRYGTMSILNKPRSAHRVSFLIHNHLREVTQRTNCLENSNATCSFNAKKTHCPSGHEFTPENTRYQKAKHGLARYCRACGRHRTLKRYYEGKSK